MPLHVCQYPWIENCSEMSIEDERKCEVCERGFTLSESSSKCIPCEIESCSSCIFLQMANSSGAIISYPTCTLCDPAFSPVEFFHWIDNLTKATDDHPIYVNRTICQPADHCAQKDGNKCIRCHEPFFLDFYTNTCVETCNLETQFQDSVNMICRRKC